MNNDEKTNAAVQSTGLSVASGSALPWQPIETAPKDGTEIALWCTTAEQLLYPCIWRGGRWLSWQISAYDQMTYLALEPYEVPTHWLKITPPNSSDEPHRGTPKPTE